MIAGYLHVVPSVITKTYKIEGYILDRKGSFDIDVRLRQEHYTNLFIFRMEIQVPITIHFRSESIIDPEIN
ncbi:hypothetical protein CBW18_20370 [Pedobacter sp. AJM]|nr:hypothetical protein CBW18_20370 [Pedobacter sp. AJM]